MKSLQDVYRNMALSALARKDTFGFSYWQKRLKEANILAEHQLSRVV